jgi:N-methylhydantoinase A/oxoprolinase/acetone carboxylase beta subunit
MVKFTGELTGIEPERICARVLQMISDRITVELLNKQFNIAGNGNGKTGIGRSVRDISLGDALVDQLLSDGNDDCRVRVELRHPVIGLGAAAAYFLPDAAKRLGAEARIPDDADVANAVGAVTSMVRVKKTAGIVPSEKGDYYVYGLSESRSFTEFDEAHRFVVNLLEDEIRDMAHSAGTSEQRIELRIDDRISEAAEGERIFLERRMVAQITGVPDVT